MTAAVAATKANHLTCWRSSPRAPTNLMIRAITESRAAPSSVNPPTSAVLSSSGPSPSIPVGLGSGRWPPR
jgi:hypothetical protein